MFVGRIKQFNLSRSGLSANILCLNVLVIFLYIRLE